jgi:flagellar biosynthesis protein FlhG
MNRAVILAIASGKGGVGKTITAVNFALTAAREGVRTALVDADPLSNVMALLDHPQPGRELPKVLEDPASQAFIAAPMFEVIFPQPKNTPEHAASLVEDLVVRHRDWLNGRYGLVIIDMPAGAEVEQDFPYLAAADALLLVTTPEPTSHVAAGNFLRNISGIWKQRPVYLWHNRYQSHPEDDFDSDDVIGNYNRNVEESLRIKNPGIIPVAFVPPDSALDLVRTDPPILVNLYRTLSDSLQGLADAALPPLPAVGAAGFRSGTVIAHFLRKAAGDSRPDSVLENIERTLGAELPDRLKQEMLVWLGRVTDSPVRRQILQVIEVVNLHMQQLESEEGVTPGKVSEMSARSVDREIIPLLKTLSCLPGDSKLIILAGLVLFHYSLARLFVIPAARNLISGFLPRRLESGISIRDRRTQIARIIGKDSLYQERYFALVKKLYPVMNRQMEHLVKSFGLQNLLFRDADAGVAGKAYLKLFSATIYEIINSGLGVVAGFRFRPSSRAFRAGFDELRKRLISS